MSDPSFPSTTKAPDRPIASVEQVFAFLDDPGHWRRMGESSMMMLGSRMSIDVDAGGGRVIGSKVRMHGRMLGIRLSLERSHHASDRSLR